jgi:hypothetical protein
MKPREIEHPPLEAGARKVVKRKQTYLGDSD